MLNRFAPHTYTLLRVMAGLMFAFHGSQKLVGWPASGGGGGPLEPMMIVAGVVELAGGILIALGLLTSPAAFLASGLMAVAYFMAHAPKGFLPIVNRGELAVVYCFLFLFITAYGGGRFSLDALIRRARGATAATPDKASITLHRPAAFGQRNPQQQERRRSAR